MTTYIFLFPDPFAFDNDLFELGQTMETGTNRSRYSVPLLLKKSIDRESIANEAKSLSIDIIVSIFLRKSICNGFWGLHICNFYQNIVILLFNRRKLFLKCMLPLFA